MINTIYQQALHTLVNMTKEQISRQEDASRTYINASMYLCALHAVHRIHQGDTVSDKVEYICKRNERRLLNIAMELNQCDPLYTNDETFIHDILYLTDIYMDEFKTMFEVRMNHV